MRSAWIVFLFFAPAVFLPGAPRSEAAVFRGERGVYEYAAGMSSGSRVFTVAGVPKSFISPVRAEWSIISDCGIKVREVQHSFISDPSVSFDAAGLSSFSVEAVLFKASGALLEIHRWLCEAVRPEAAAAGFSASDAVDLGDAEDGLRIEAPGGGCVDIYRFRLPRAGEGSSLDVKPRGGSEPGVYLYSSAKVLMPGGAGGMIPLGGLPGGEYYLKIQSEPQGGYEIVFSLSLECAPSVPAAPSGAGSGKTGVFLSFSASGSSCPCGGDVEYMFDWGDGHSAWGAGIDSKSWDSAGVYGVRARARCRARGGVSGWSAPFPAEIIPDRGGRADDSASRGPQPPVGVRAIPGGNSAAVLWSSAGGGGERGYRLYACAGVERPSPGDFSLLAELPAGEFEYTHSGLSSGVKYFYMLTSVDSGGSESGVTSDIAWVVPGAGESGRLEPLEWE